MRCAQGQVARKMSDQAIATVHQPTLPARKPAAPKTIRVTGKVRAALDLMVWGALPRKDAAEKAGISEHGLYKALRKPPVKAYYLAECEVLRSSSRARNIHRLEEIRDAGNNMPAVNAIKTLEQIGDDPATISSTSQRSPGVVIVITSSQPQIGHLTQIDAKPLKLQDDV